MRDQSTTLSTHSDAADSGWGGTAGIYFRSGVDETSFQGIWGVRERAKTIAFRE